MGTFQQIGERSIQNKKYPKNTVDKYVDTVCIL